MEVIQMFSTKDIHRLYHDEKYSAQQVADILGCKKSIVLRCLRGNLRTPQEAGMIRTIRSLFGTFPEEFKRWN